MLKHIDAMLQNWTEYHVRMLENSGIGYPGQSPLVVIREYGTRVRSKPAGSIVPFLRRTPDSIKRLDRVMRVLPDFWLEVVREHYTQHRDGRGRHNNARLDRLHHIVQGALLMLDA